MCGLAGFARHPDGEEIAGVVATWIRLLASHGHRGRDATGAATLDGPDTPPNVWKAAMPVTAAIRSGPWQRGVIEQITSRTTIVLGHVRKDTMGNPHCDAAAHPFAARDVIGAHNGIITNWGALARKYPEGRRWIVDSQAAIHVLARHKDPAEALRLLDGWWALTWARRGQLYLTRSATDPGARAGPLAYGYVREWRTMFYASEERILRDALRVVGAGSTVKVVIVDRILAFDPTTFGDACHHTTHGLWLPQRPAATPGATHRRSRVGPRMDDTDSGVEEIFTRLAALERAVQALGNKVAALVPESTDADPQSLVSLNPRETPSLFDED